MNKQFKALFDCDIQQTYFSPGRVNLIGEHIDYNGGMVLPMAISIGTYGYVRMRNDEKVRVYSQNFPETGMIEFSVNQLIKQEKDGWANYVKAVIKTIKELGFEIKTGFDLLINGTIPNSSGLSSSASLEVLIGRILIDNFQLDITDVELALLTQKAENEFIGVNCGIMDQFIIANGTSEGALLIDTASLNSAIVRFDLGAYNLVILNSNKKRGLVESAYNERRQSCEMALKKAQTKYPVNNLCELTMEQLNNLGLNELDYRRVHHVITESIRVDQSIEQLSKGKIKAFGQTLYAGHNSLRDDYEVSCPELDFLVEQCQENDAIGARMTGAGFGGCVIALMDQASVDNLAELQTMYEEKFGLKLEVILAKVSGKTQRIN